MRFLVFQHISLEHPAIFGRFMDEAGIGWDAVELDEGQPIPRLEDYDALLAMGGPMDVWEQDEHPWLRAEKAAMRRAVQELRMPVLGVCLGHQVLAEALGGRVGLMDSPEVGIMEVALTPAAAEDPVFRHLPAAATVLQWHAAAVLEPPPGATVLAASPACPIQAFRVGPAAYGIQYHVEIMEQTVADWASVPAYARALEKALGPGSLERLRSDVAARMADFNRDARQLFDGFLAAVASRSG